MIAVEESTHLLFIPSHPRRELAVVRVACVVSKERVAAVANCTPRTLDRAFLFLS